MNGSSDGGCHFTKRAERMKGGHLREITPVNDCRHKMTELSVGGAAKSASFFPSRAPGNITRCMTSVLDPLSRGNKFLELNTTSYDLGGFSGSQFLQP